MTPADIMATFEARGPLPREALHAAGQSRDAMVPVFLDYIDRLQTTDIDDLDGLDAFIFIFHLLAEWREPRAYRPLATLLRRDPEFLDALMGDAITESSARVMAGVFDGDLKPLFDIILDGTADGFVRGEMFDTLAIVALKDPVLQPPVAAFLTDFFDLAPPATGEEVWWPWAESIAALGLSSMATQVRAVFDSGLITPDHSSYEHFDQRLQATVDKGRPVWFEEESSNRLIADTITELATWHCFSAEYLTKRSSGRLNDLAALLPRSMDPFTEVFAAKTGRNDPCPCGSGKKFKKCCLN